MAEHYKKALDEAERELHELSIHHAQGEKRMAQLRLTINGLRALSEESAALDETQEHERGLPTGSPLADMGLTDAVREVLKASQFPCTAGMIRDELEDSEYNVDRYSNILATIAVVLKRLVDQGEARPMKLVDAAADKTYAAYLHIPTQSQRINRNSAPVKFSRIEYSPRIGKQKPVGTRPKK
jgi:hypothetical protein